jgi:benzoyl-CoA reductase subunit D
MITVGIDSGIQNTKAIALCDKNVIGRAAAKTEFDVADAAYRLFEQLLYLCGIERGSVSAIASTGIGRDMVTFADSNVNEVISAQKGASFVNPGCGIVIDVGAETSRVIRLNPDGTVKNYEANDKCAAGGGTFIETMARALQIKTEEVGLYSLRHTKTIPMNAQCVVFVESEVISLIHQRESIDNIAHSVLVGISNRICSMARRLEIVDGITFIGGPAKNAGLIACLENALKKDVFVPTNPDYVSAIGAALHAAENAK